MAANSYEDWISIYNNIIEATWESERPELQKLCMIYCAFKKEVKNLRNTLDQELSQIRAELKKKDQLQKCTKFKGLAQTEDFDDIIEDKENETPAFAPIQDEIIHIESPSSSEYILSSPKQDENAPQSPILKQRSFNRPRRKKYRSLYPLIQEKKVETPKLNDSNIMDSSILEGTPEVEAPKKSKLSQKKSKKQRKSALTEFFDNKIDFGFSPRTRSELPRVNGSSDSDTLSELDQLEEITDDIKQEESSENKLEGKDKQEDQFVFHEVVRGNARKKLKGWSCSKCEQYYSGQSISPEDLEKKMDECSKHKSKFKPRNETIKGFWDITVGSTPTGQNTEQSVVFDYKTKF